MTKAAIERRMSETASPPFDDLRRLTGPNLYFAEPGAVLETMVGAPVAPALMVPAPVRCSVRRSAVCWWSTRRGTGSF